MVTQPNLPNVSARECRELEYLRLKKTVSNLLGCRLRAARSAAALSQEEVAERAGITVKTYGELERGWSARGAANPRMDTLLRVYYALGIEPV